MLTRRQFVAGATAVGAVIALPIPRSRTYQVGKEPWVRMSSAQQDEFKTWLSSHGVSPDHTYRVDVHDAHMLVYQYHGDPPWHRADRCGGSRGGGSRDDVCRVPPFEVAL